MDAEREAVANWLHEAQKERSASADIALIGMPTQLNDGRKLWLGWNRCTQWATRRDALLKCTADESKKVLVDPSEYDNDHYINDVLAYAHAGKVRIPGVVVSGALDAWIVPSAWSQKKVAWTIQALGYTHEHSASVRYRLSSKPMQFNRLDGRLDWGYALELGNLPGVKCVLTRNSWQGWLVIELGTMRSFGRSSSKRAEAIASAWECVAERGAEAVVCAIRSVRDLHNPQYALPAVALVPISV